MIPARYQNASYDDVPENIKEAMRDMKTSKRGLYIHGGVGCGKTHIAYALKQKAESVFKTTASFWNTTEMFDAIRDDFDAHWSNKQHVLESLMESEKLLFLDDIGAEKPTEWVQERFYLLLNRRYNEMRPTIFTSNYAPGELSVTLGDRVVSRIVESCHIIKIIGEDRRV